ncbi:MAG: hypothetical protein ABL883_06415 [Terricaulis sp.]
MGRAWRAWLLALTAVAILALLGLWIERDKIVDLLRRNDFARPSSSLVALSREFMAKIEEEFPEEHAALSAEISKLESEGATREQAFTAGQTLLSGLIADHISDLRRAQDEALEAIADARADSLEYLQRESAGACASYSRGMAVSPDIGLAISDEAKAAVLRGSIAVLDAIISAEQSPKTQADLTQEERNALLEGFTRSSLEVMADDGSQQYSEERICASALEYWRAIAQAPRELKARATLDALIILVGSQAAAAYADMPAAEPGRPTAGDLQIACQHYLDGTGAGVEIGITNTSPETCVIMSMAAIRTREGMVPGEEMRFCLPDSPGTRLNPANSMAHAYLNFYEPRAVYIEQKDGLLAYLAAMINSWPCS